MAKQKGQIPPSVKKEHDISRKKKQESESDLPTGKDKRKPKREKKKL